MTFVTLGDVDIDKILTQRQSVPRTVMGTAMLTRDRSPPTVAGDVDGSNSGSDEPVLPATLDDFSAPPGSPHIHEPPKPPVNPKETAPQRFKKGNLRLMQTDDGGWKLEELEEKRRSLEANSPKNTSYETEDRRTSPGQKPPAADKRRKKGSKSTEENGHKDSQLLRRYQTTLKIEKKNYPTVKRLFPFTLDYDQTKIVNRTYYSVNRVP